MRLTSAVAPWSLFCRKGVPSRASDGTVRQCVETMFPQRADTVLKLGKESAV